MDNIVTVTRTTTESEMKVAIDFSGTKADYRKDINTGITFLNHMIEHIAWRGGINITMDVSLDQFALSHVVCEDLGIAFGKAIATYIAKNGQNGITGYGDAIGIIDEAKATAAFSFESRSLFDFTTKVPLTEQVEGMATEDLPVFLEGMCQGANCTLHLDIEKGKNAHHVWEAAFRAVGIALKRALCFDESRVGKTAGVAGAIQFKIED